MIVKEGRFVDIYKFPNDYLPVKGKVGFLWIDKMFYHTVFTVVLHLIQPFPELVPPSEICGTGGYDLDKCESLFQKGLLN